jgi:hypothetical protein
MLLDQRRTGAEDRPCADAPTSGAGYVASARRLANCRLRSADPRRRADMTPIRFFLSSLREGLAEPPGFFRDPRALR